MSVGFEPQKFFVGLIDFFSVLLPGAIFVYVIKDVAGPRILGAGYPAAADAQGLAVFLVSSYLAGHFIFLAGAWLDEVYDIARRATLDRCVVDLAWRGRLQPSWRRALLWLVFRSEQDAAVTKASAIKAAYLNPLDATSAVNTFQWAKLHLAAELPEALGVVQRFEADSKFFRSLVVVLLALPVAAPGLRRPEALAGIALLTWLALWRYAEQRLKATNQAYWTVIALEGRRGKVTVTRPPVRDGEPTHAGGVVLRRVGKEACCLLVEAKKNPDEWVLPKGHVEPGEHPRVTAVREVHEETGVWARHRIGPDGQPVVLDVVSYQANGEDVRCRYFLMDYAGRGRTSEPHRQSAWVSMDAAVPLVQHDSLRRVISAAARSASDV
ncbi:MAG: NUDIX domain-containing protein [Acidobacteriota bacterium]|nr:NUDIX domain-containing protein [Acidobacteriota bacterium]